MCIARCHQQRAVAGMARLHQVAWCLEQADEVKEVTVGAGRGQLSKEALRAVITFLYTYAPCALVLKLR